MVARVVSVVFLVIVVSCASGPPGSDGGTACNDDSQCATGERCVSDVCQTLCDSDSDCEPAESCSASGACSIVNTECTANTDCRTAGSRCGGDPNAECVGGQCLCGLCTENAECEDTNQCTLDQCVRGACEIDNITRLGDLCTINSANDGQCVDLNGAAVCTLALGSSCDVHEDCGAGTCECSNITCTDRVCSDTPCDCGFGSGGTCTNTLPSGTADANDCHGPTACFGSTGECKLRDGEACTDDSACGNGNCVCANGPCSSRVCAPVDCPCQYGDDTGCLGTLVDGTDDPGNCDGPNSCYSGACLGDVGQPCADDGQCGTLECECSGASCVNKVCAATSCTCQWGINGACDQPVLDGPTDPLDCATSCSAGQCTASLGEACLTDAACVQGECECENASCSALVCATPGCLCNYGPAGACTTPLPDGTQDANDCDGDFACYGGACMLANGSECVQDADCGSGQCECTAADCTTRACAVNDCACGWGVAGACDNNLPDGVSDPEDCDATALSCFGGACLVEDGGTCAVNDDCASGSCQGLVCQASLCVGAALTDVPYSGAGTSPDPFLLCTPTQYEAFSTRNQDWGAYVQMGAHLDMTGITVGDTNFSGEFDGRGYELRNLALTRAGNTKGLFARVNGGGEVRNLSLVNADLSVSNSTVGLLVGQVDSGSLIENCHIQGTLTPTGQEVGGLVGESFGNIRDCSADVTLNVVNFQSVYGGLVGRNSGQIETSWSQGALVTPNSGTTVGGLVGENNGGTITGCWSSAQVSGSLNLGGLVGLNFGPIGDSYATGDVTGSNGSSLGGLIGRNSDMIARVYATGSVTGGSSAVGGLVGTNDSTITDAYATGDVNANSQQIGGLIGDNNGNVGRTYAAGDVDGNNASDVGGHTGIHDAGSIDDSFAVGRVFGGFTSVDGFIGDLSGGGMLNNWFYDADTIDDADFCSEGSNPVGACEEEAVLSSFYTEAGQVVFGNWDFATVWQENPGALPTLR